MWNRQQSKMNDLRKELEDYIKKLEGWELPLGYGSASGSITKSCILEDLKGLLK